MNKTKISVRNLCRSFAGRDGTRIEALHNVSFEVEDAFSPDGKDIGEFSVLLGPSGCGKSTLLRMIAGLDRPDAGSLETISSETDKRPAVAYVFQDANLLP